MAEANQSRPRKERKHNAERRRRQLLDAARRSILKHGLGKTTLATVADAAGLSQGVAVFYFQSKAGLLTETLRDLYQGYHDHWTAALDAAGNDPADQLRALLRADFDEEACGRDVLPLWFAFWGELHFQSTYDAVAEDFDNRRRQVIEDICRRLLTDAPEGEAERVAEWLDTLSDGYWQRLHLAPASFDRDAAYRTALDWAERVISGVAGRPIKG